MTTFLAVAAYASALVAANLSIAHFGVAAAPFNAFFLIGLDLALRDALHSRIAPSGMLALLACTGALTYALNPAAGAIAAASLAAYLAAAMADWGVFAALHKRPWLQRSNASNVAGAAVDSLVFPTLAFGALMPEVVALQFAAKVAGGAAWAWAFQRRASR